MDIYEPKWFDTRPRVPQAVFRFLFRITYGTFTDVLLICGVACALTTLIAYFFIL